MRLSTSEHVPGGLCYVPLQLTASFFTFPQIFVVASPVLPSPHPLTSYDSWHIIYCFLHSPSCPPKLLWTAGALLRNNDVRTLSGRKFKQKEKKWLVKVKDQYCNKLPQKVLEDSCFVAFRTKLDNFSTYQNKKTQ